MWTNRLIWLLVAGATALSGCDDVVSSQSVLATAVLGPEGGTLSLGAVSVELPPGALAADVTVRIQLAANHPDGNIGPVYSIEAEGAKLLAPATISYQVQTANLPAETELADVLLAFVQDGAWQPLTGSAMDAGAGIVSGQTMHFSEWGAIPPLPPIPCSKAADCPEMDCMLASCDDGGCAYTADPECEECNPDCQGKECGDDGCDGSCGKCEGPQEGCVEGMCVECEEQCTVGEKGCTSPDSRWECIPGPEGCAVQADWECAPDTTCVNGECSACVPDCEWKQCGTDGCGGICGKCPCEGCSAAATTCSFGTCGTGCAGCDCNCMFMCPLLCPGPIDQQCLDSCSVMKMGFAFGSGEFGDCMEKHGYYECAPEDEECLDAAFDACIEELCSCNTGDKNCQELHECVSDCGDGPCTAICGYTSTDKANDAWEVVTECLELAGYYACPEEDILCLDEAWESCDQEFGECIGCTPDCEGKECGDDGCGGSCGECPEAYECVAGTCEEEGGCVPNCMVDEGGDKYLSECGTPDGCGGMCDECEPDDVCALADYAEVGVCFNPEEECPEICAVDEDAECGTVWAGFVWPDCECGDCPGEQEACINNKCVCQPDCEDKDCGDDGCGGSCGECENGFGCKDDTCQENVCGNGLIDEGEDCDDGNNNDGDGCDTECNLEYMCGNGQPEGNEECDDGNTDNGDGCDADCNWEALCGDGIEEPPEQCDDGNTEDGDGCSADCKNEQ